jgi:hypothetical protein
MFIVRRILLIRNWCFLIYINKQRLTLQFICTWCRLQTFYLMIEESSNWTVLSKTDYNCFVDHTTLLRRATKLFTTCINRAATTTYRSNFFIISDWLYAMWTEEAWFENSEFISKDFWSKDRIRKDFRVFWTSTNRKLREEKKRRKIMLFEVDLFDESVNFDRLFYLHSVSSVNEIMTWKNESKHCEKDTFTILAREKIRDATKSSSRRIFVVDASSERERQSEENSDTRENCVISKVVIVLFDDSRFDEHWTLLFFFARDISFFSTWLFQIVKNVYSILRTRRRRSDDSNTT